MRHAIAYGVGEPRRDIGLIVYGVCYGFGDLLRHSGGWCGRGKIDQRNLALERLLRNDRVKTSDGLALVGVYARINKRGILIPLELIDRVVHELTIEHTQ